MTIHHNRLAEVTHLETGWHPDGEAFCFAEAIAYVAGEPYTDEPECACYVLVAYGDNLNEVMPDDQRQRLIPYVPRLIGTRSERQVGWRRAYVLADAAVRVSAPLALRAAGLEETASKLEALSVIDSEGAAMKARAAAREAEKTALSLEVDTGSSSRPVRLPAGPPPLLRLSPQAGLWSASPVAKTAWCAARSAWTAARVPPWDTTVALYSARAAAYAALAVESAGSDPAEVWDRALEALDAALAVKGEEG